MDDLGVKLDAEAAFAIADRGVGRIARARDAAKARRQSGNVVAVAHPYRQRGRQSVEQLRGRAQLNVGGAVLALGAWVDTSAELMGEKLHSVTNTEHR